MDTDHTPDPAPVPGADDAPSTKDAPEPALRGTFALYETPAGGMHLAWRADGEEEAHHVEVPAFAVTMAKAQIDGDGRSAGFLGRFAAKRVMRG
jgi:hypothetical protein